jgi:hypothetical protein
MHVWKPHLQSVLWVLAESHNKMKVTFAQAGLSIPCVMPLETISCLSIEEMRTSCRDNSLLLVL